MCSIGEPVARVVAALDAVEHSEPALCERPERVIGLARAAAAAHGLYLRELGLIDASGELDGSGAASTVAWIRRETGRSEHDARGDVLLARRLRDLPVLLAASVVGDLPPRTI